MRTLAAILLALGGFAAGSLAAGAPPPAIVVASPDEPDGEDARGTTIGDAPPSIAQDADEVVPMARLRGRDRTAEPATAERASIEDAVLSDDIEFRDRLPRVVSAEPEPQSLDVADLVYPRGPYVIDALVRWAREYVRPDAWSKEGNSLVAAEDGRHLVARGPSEPIAAIGAFLDATRARLSPSKPWLRLRYFDIKDLRGLFDEDSLVEHLLRRVRRASGREDETEMAVKNYILIVKSDGRTLDAVGDYLEALRPPRSQPSPTGDAARPSCVDEFDVEVAQSPDVTYGLAPRATRPESNENDDVFVPSSR